MTIGYIWYFCLCYLNGKWTTLTSVIFIIKEFSVLINPFFWDVPKKFKINCYLIFVIIVNSTFFFIFNQLFFFRSLYDKARVLIVWFWGVSLWVGKSCKMRWPLTTLVGFLFWEFKLKAFYLIEYVIWNLFNKH